MPSLAPVAVGLNRPSQSVRMPSGMGTDAQVREMASNERCQMMSLSNAEKLDGAGKTSTAMPRDPCWLGRQGTLSVQQG